MTFKTTSKIYLAILVYIIWVLFYISWDYSQEHKHLYQAIDKQLTTIASTTPLLLPKQFHHRGMQPGDIDPTVDLNNTLHLSKLVENNDIAYTYTLIKQQDRLFFTSSSSTVNEIQQHKYLYNYFLLYDDADPRITQVFSDSKPLFIDITDTWGHFRSVFILQTSTDGTPFISAADMEISHIQAILNQRLTQKVIIAVIFLLLLLPIMLAFTAAQRRWARELEIRVRQRTQALHSTETRLTSIIEHSPVGIFHYDQTSKITMINQRVSDILGASSSALVNFNMLEKLEDGALLGALKESLNGNIGYFEGPYVSVTGHRSRYLIAEFVPLKDEMGKVNGGVAVFDDTTEQQASLNALRKLSMAVEQSPNAVVITDINGTIEYVNPKFSDITGYSAAEALGQNPRLLNSGETSKEVYQDLWQTLLSGQEWRGIFHNKRKNGEFYWAEDFISPLTNNLGAITHFVALQQDITEVRRITDQIDFQSTHDPLTGLLNRRQFENQLTQTIEKTHRNLSHHILCFIDIDQFKIINSSCGHLAGDEMLRQLSNLIRARLRNHDSLARPGGDEFLLLLENASLARGEYVVQMIMADLKQFRFQWEEHSFSVEISAGITIIDQHTSSAMNALQEVDTACYTAKEAGRNRIHIYNEQDEQQSTHRGYIQWANEIHRALEEDAFRLYAQPIVALQNKQKIGYEILLRLQSDSGQIVAPDAFLPAAERYNIAPQIDRWVIRNCLQWMTDNLDKLEHVANLAINLSGQSLGDDALLGFITHKIQQSPIPASMIKFEITETAAIGNLKSAQVFIRTLRKLGCKFALDDFGSGLSSFAYLKNLPVDMLKIDGMFVRNILTDPIDEAMVRSINEVGHIMGMKTIAEFVETDEIMLRLKALGVDYAQGYAISRPMPIDTILQKTPLPSL